uniref:Ig-like domain-containing protein n=1 Tax=Zosterops lateralis melanops TaxID=1220523 RepID=A0A8D2PNK2_ZOSLA
GQGNWSAGTRTRAAYHADGAQATHILVEPPWMPAVLWDLVTLTCQGSGTTGATTWYKDGQRWDQEGLNHFTVTESGSYTCDRPGSDLSPAVTILNDQLVLQVPPLTLLEGDTVTLRCRVMQDMSVTGVRFYCGDKEVSRSSTRTELSLSPLQLNQSGQYHCQGLVSSEVSQEWQESAPVAVTVHGEHPHNSHLSTPTSPPQGLGVTNLSPLSFPELFTVPVLEGPPEPIEGRTLGLRAIPSTASPIPHIPIPLQPPHTTPNPPQVTAPTTECRSPGELGPSGSRYPHPGHPGHGSLMSAVTCPTPHQVTFTLLSVTLPGK